MNELVAGHGRRKTHRANPATRSWTPPKAHSIREARSVSVQRSSDGLYRNDAPCWCHTVLLPPPHIHTLMLGVLLLIYTTDDPKPAPTFSLKHYSWGKTREMQRSMPHRSSGQEEELCSPRLPCPGMAPWLAHAWKAPWEALCYTTAPAGGL